MSSQRDAAMMILGDLVGFPTVTSESNLPLIEYTAAVLEPLGADLRVTYDDTGLKANLLATIGPATGGGVVLSGHSDVVPAEEPDWTGSPFLAMRRDQKIYGRGTADMKGFIACALAMAPVYAAEPLRRPVHIAVTFDEEVGCKGAPLLIDDMVRNLPMPGVAIVGEPTGMRVITSHKGCYEYTTTITGLEGHGSAPGRAVNAVQFGARYVSRLMELAETLRLSPPPGSPYDPPHTTISVGRMNGGTARNVVAGECVIEWEMRPVRHEDVRLVLDDIAGFEAELTSKMQAVSPQAAIHTVTEGAVDGLEDVASPAVDLTISLLGAIETGVAAFGTEAGLYQMGGIPAVVCGPGEIGVAHRPNEHLSLEQLETCLEMMDALIGRLREE